MAEKTSDESGLSDSVAGIVPKKEETNLIKVENDQKIGKRRRSANGSGSSEKSRFQKYLCSDLKFHPYKCLKCYACFREKNLYESHKRVDACFEPPKHHLKHVEKPTYPCPTCGITFSTPLKRSAHMKTHTKCCAACGLYFKTDCDLFDHTAEVHLNFGTKNKKLQPTGRNEEGTLSLKDHDSSINQEGCMQNTKTDSTAPVDQIKGFSSSIEKVNVITIDAEDKEHFNPIVREEHASLGESAESTCASNLNEVSVKTEEIPLMSNAINNPIDVVAKIEHALNIIMGNNLTSQLSSEVQNEEVSEVRKMLMEIQSKVTSPLSNDTTDDLSDVDPLLITESLDNSTRPALHFNNYLHINWLIDFINALKFTCYPLMDITVEKITHINTSILQQLPEPTGILCVKENYMCLVEAQKQLSEFLQNHFRSVGGLMS